MKHNSYFDGKVQSLALNTPEGPATAGVIEPGKYTFKTDSEERMQVIAGAFEGKTAGCRMADVCQGPVLCGPGACVV